MARVYKSICVEIDELTIKIIHLSEKIVNYKLEVEKIMNNGFVNIAKARYIMGSKCVSTLQLPTVNSNPIQPLATVCRAPHEGYWVFKASRRNPTPLSSDEKILKDNIKSDTTRTNVIKDLLQKEPENIRKRKEFYLVEDTNYKELNEELQDEVSTDSSESTDSQVSFTDPVRLFGVLVPYTLRVAQKSFQDVINVLVNIATIQSETDMVLKRYYHLLKVKNLIESAAEERDIDLTEDKEYWTPSEKDSETSEVISGNHSGHSVSEEYELELQEKLVPDEVDLEIEGEAGQIIPGEGTEYFKSGDEYVEEDCSGESLEKSDTSQN